MPLVDCGIALGYKPPRAHCPSTPRMHMGCSPRGFSLRRHYAGTNPCYAACIARLCVFAVVGIPILHPPLLVAEPLTSARSWSQARRDNLLIVSSTLHGEACGPRGVEPHVALPHYVWPLGPMGERESNPIALAKGALSPNPSSSCAMQLDGPAGYSHSGCNCGVAGTLGVRGARGVRSYEP